MHPLLVILAMAAAVPSPAAVSGSGFRMALPPPITKHTESVRLPWGRAVETVRYSGDAAETLLIFGTYDWPSGRSKVDRAGLRHMRTAFLRNRGCTATDVRGIGLRDADDKLWPQSVFEGECEGGDSFRAAFVVVNGALYHFQVVQQATLHPQARPPLSEVLKTLVSAFSARD